MNPIGYREFKNDLEGIFLDREVNHAVLYALYDDATTYEEREEILDGITENLGKMKMLAQIIRSLPYYEDIGHLFPPFS